MIPKLTPEQLTALRAFGDKPLTVRDPETNQVYVLVDSIQHERAMDALRKLEDLEAIQKGISDVESGRIAAASEAFDRVANKLHSRYSR